MKKLISITRCFFTVCVPYKPWKTLRKPGNIGTQKATIFSPLVFHRFRPHDLKPNPSPMPTQSPSLEECLLARNWLSRAFTAVRMNFGLAIRIVRLKFLRAANGGLQTGGVRTGGFPDLDLSFPFYPFLSFLGLSRFFRDFPDLLVYGPGISRFVPFLFLGLLRTPTRNSPERVRDRIWTFPGKVRKKWETPWFGTPGLPSPKNCCELMAILLAAKRERR